MNLLLTDQLDCPRCLDGGGLILLADRMDGRTVHAGQLGCPLCRTRFPVENGVGDFSEGADAVMAEQAAADALAVAALFGITEGPATVLMLGAFEGVADQLAGIVPDLRVVVAHPGARAASEAELVSVLRTGARVPLRAASMRAVLVGKHASDRVADALRVCGLAGRIVMDGVSDAARAEVRAGGYRVVAEDADRMVAVRVA
jgi:hypothetical protein